MIERSINYVTFLSCIINLLMKMVYFTTVTSTLFNITCRGLRMICAVVEHN